MNVEEERLATFHEWPSNAAIGSSCLAKAGFYYTGRFLEVQCFVCGSTISDWNYGDQAMARHRQMAPDCPFVVDPTGTCNVPLIPTTAGVTSESTTPSSTRQSNSVEDLERRLSLVTPLTHSDLKTFSQRLRTFAKWPLALIIRPEQLASAGFYYLQYKDLVECVFCKGILMNWKAGDNPEEEHKLNFPNCDFYMREMEDDSFGLVTFLSDTSTDLKELGVQMHTVSKSQFTTYEKRLQTFQNWPKNLNQTPEMLAAAGFYYHGYDDRVRCFHCDGGLHSWQPTDDVWVEHACWYPNCNFVILMRGRKFIKDSRDKRGFLNLSIFSDVPGGNNAIETSTTSLSTMQLGETITNTTVSITDDTETSVTSNPLILQLNESIIEPETPMPSITDTAVTSSPLVLQSNKPVTDVIAPVMTGAEDTTATSVLTNLQANKPVPDITIKGLLDTVPVRIALEIGIHMDRIIRVLKKRMDEVGEPYVTFAQLIEAILEDKQEDHARLVNSISGSPSLKLKTSFNQVPQSPNNSTSKKAIQKSDIAENIYDKKEIDDESNYIMSLQEESRKLKEARLCKICMDNELAIVFLPCGHLVTCNNCIPTLTICPLCRLKIRAYVRIFLS